METTTPIPAVVAAVRRLADADATLARALEAWRLDAAAELRRLSDAFDRHVAAVDAPGGLYDDTVSREPRLTHQVDLLRREERALRARLDEALLTLAEPHPAPGAPGVEELHAMVHDVAARFERYHSRALSLSFDAVNLELGEPV